MYTVKRRHVADALYQCAAGAPGEFGEHGIALGTFGTTHLDLDQFVVEQHPLGFGAYRVREAGFADQDQRLQGVGFAAQKAQLVFGQ